MHRAQFVAQLERYADRYPDESEVTARYIEFVRNHRDCFERSLAVGHVTGSAWVLDKARKRTLLTHHKKLDRWLQLGGHVDGSPQVIEAAAREAREESGIETLTFVYPEIFDLDIHTIPAQGDEPEHFHFDARFLFCATKTEEFVVGEESNELAWVPLNELDEYTQEESIQRMAKKTPTG
jgi:8-oxo-dGTP pyrophosphatase MutT (NUDIX family)